MTEVFSQSQGWPVNEKLKPGILI